MFKNIENYTETLNQVYNCNNNYIVTLQEQISIRKNLKIYTYDKFEICCHKRIDTPPPILGDHHSQKINEYLCFKPIDEMKEDKRK